jgi:hypothetical protein
MAYVKDVLAGKTKVSTGNQERESYNFYADLSPPGNQAYQCSSIRGVLDIQDLGSTSARSED